MILDLIAPGDIKSEIISGSATAAATNLGISRLS